MSSYRTISRRIARKIAAAAVVVALTACGTGDGDSASDDGHEGHDERQASASAGKHNSADVAFAQGMIPHHRQAVEMSDLAAERAGSARVKKLAAEIKKAQGPEIRTMKGWLKSWDEPVPDPSDGEDESGGSHDGHDSHGDHEMPGMLTDTDMEVLAESEGEAFDAAFLELMIEHHEGAVDMADTERAEGTYPEAKDMAKEIVSSQSAEITAMNELLGKG